MYLLVPTYLSLVFDGKVCACAYAGASDADEEREVNCDATWLSVIFPCSSSGTESRISLRQRVPDSL